MKDKNPEILDVTLRDGSYLIDFQFTAEDTARIAGALDAVGFRWIEVGHGFGLNASRAGKGAAAATDEEYMDAAARSVQFAKLGVFCIPGIARLEDLDSAARHGMAFVRIGTNITELDQAESYIKRAKEHGLVVSYNAMKSYAISSDEFGRAAACAWSWGADVVCLVDSAGGMMPKDVTAYLTAARLHGDGDLGFHGHDNLSLAMANSLTALDCGAAFVDASLQGVGRSAGNVITEALVAVLKQRKLCDGIDLNGVMDIGQAIVSPATGVKRVDPLAITAGYAMFHSSFTTKVEHYARKYGVDVRDVIVKLTSEDRVNAPDELLERICQELVDTRIPRVITVPSIQIQRKHFPDAGAQLTALADEVHSKGIRLKKFSAINIVVGEAPTDEMRVSGNIQDSAAHIIGSVTVSSEAQLQQAAETIDGKVDVVFLDVDTKPFGPCNPAQSGKRVVRRSLLLTYSDSRVWIAAVEDQVVRLLGEALSGVSTVIIGDHPKSRSLAIRLAERQAAVLLVGATTSAPGAYDLPITSGGPAVERMLWNDAGLRQRIEQASLLILWTGPGGECDEDVARGVGSGTVVLDAGMGTLTASAVRQLRQNGASAARLNIWPALAGALEAAHESERVVREDLGLAAMAGVAVVAGGSIGLPGEVVVDSVCHPTRVVGVVNERGGLDFKYDADAQERVRRVKDEINRRSLARML